jgi:hypothetical protein
MTLITNRSRFDLGQDKPSLPAIIDRASALLVNARSAAEILEARDLASFVYDAAKKTGRLTKAKGACDDLVVAAARMQADALLIEATAKRRLADEYDAAQERGEVQSAGGDRVSNIPKRNNAATVGEIGLSSKGVHEARLIRDAENADPGIVKRTVEKAIAEGEEPTKAKVRKAARATVGRQLTKQCNGGDPVVITPATDAEVDRLALNTSRRALATMVIGLKERLLVAHRQIDELKATIEKMEKPARIVGEIGIQSESGRSTVMQHRASADTTRVRLAEAMHEKHPTKG